MFIKEACVGIWYYHFYLKWLKLHVIWSNGVRNTSIKLVIHFWDSSILDSNLIAKRFQDIKKTQSVFCQDKRQLYVIWNRQNKEEWEKRGLRIKQRHFLRRQCTNKTSKYQTKATTELCNEGILSKLSWCSSCYCVLWYTKLLYDVMMLWLRRI